MDEARKVEWETGTRETLRGFPDEVKSEFGQGLYLAEQDGPERFGHERAAGRSR